MPDAIVVGTRFRAPTTASRRENGGVVLRQGHRYVALDATEFQLVVDFVRDEPELGQLARFPIAPKAPESQRASDD
jgi:hypothetical protein